MTRDEEIVLCNKAIEHYKPANQVVQAIEELGELAAFLASNESSYITAQGIVIDGASTLPETMTMGI